MIQGPPKIAILGGGIAGLSLAYRLMEQGASFDLYLGSKESLECSRLAQGVATLKGYRLARGGLFAAKMAGHHQLMSIMQKSQFAGFGTQVTELFPTKADYIRRVTRTYHRRFRGFCDMSSRQLGDGAGLYPVAHDYPSDYVFSASLLCDHLLRLIRDWPLARVISSEYDPCQVHVGDHEHVVVALGALTSQWLKQLGYLSGGGDTFTRGCVAEFVSDAHNWLRHALGSPPGQEDSVRFWGFKQGAQSLRIERHHQGSYGCFVGSYDQSKSSAEGSLPAEGSPIELQSKVQVDDVASESLAQLARSFGLQVSASEESTWKLRWGVRYSGKGGRPIVGELPSITRKGLGNGPGVTRLWVFSGFHRSGFSLAPMLSVPLAAMITGLQGSDLLKLPELTVKQPAYIPASSQYHHHL